MAAGSYKQQVRHWSDNKVAERVMALERQALFAERVPTEKDQPVQPGPPTAATTAISAAATSTDTQPSESATPPVSP